MACLDKILKEFPDIDEKEVKILEDHLNRVKQKLIDEGKLSEVEGALKAKANEMISEIEIDAMEAERNQMLMSLKSKEIKDTIKAATDAGFDPEEGLAAVAVGSKKIFKGSLDSADVLGQSVEVRMLSGFMTDIHNYDRNLLKMFNKEKFNDDFVKEMFHFDKGNPRSLTGNKDAFELAKIARKHKSIAVKIMNESGGFIREIDTHVMTQSHNAIKIRKLGRKSYIEMMKNRLDHERTFGSADPDKFLEAVYNNITSGEHSLFLARVRGAEKPAKGIGRTAVAISRGRKLHFKDADSFLAYNKDFGTQAPLQGMLTNFHSAARTTGLMRKFGPDAGNTFEKELTNIVETAKKGDKPLSAGRKKSLRKKFDEVAGIAEMPESPRLAGISAGIRNVNSMISLGLSTITSITDVVTSAANLHYHGKGFLSSYHGTLSNAISGRAKGVERAIAIDLLDVAFDGMLGSVATRFNLGGGGVGNLSKLTNMFFSVNRLQWWTDLMKEGQALMLSRHLAANMGDVFDDLTADTIRLLKIHGIGQKEWGLIRKSRTKLANNKEYITPDSIRDLDKNLFKNSREQVDLEDRLRGLFIAESDIAVPTPGARERAFARTGRPGSILGTAGELFWQFKMFPLTLASKVWPRQMASGVPGIVHLATMTTLFGYASMSLKDMAKGRTPRDPNSAKTWTDAFVNGGGAGILGDFLFQDFNIYGRDFLSTIAGPSFGRVNDIASVFALARQGKDSAASKAFALIRKNIPFGNLPMAEMALGYMFMWHIQEALNPGYFRRIEKRIEKQNKQKIFNFAKASEAIK